MIDFYRTVAITQFQHLTRNSIFINTKLFNDLLNAFLTNVRVCLNIRYPKTTEPSYKYLKTSYIELYININNLNIIYFLKILKV